MKRKLALLLAGTMVLSTVSTSTIFAANGEMNLVSTIGTSSTTLTTSPAAVKIGDNTQVIPAGAAFTFELVNGKFEEGTATYANAGTSRITNSTSRINVITGAEVTDGSSLLNFNFKATDSTKPVYLKVTYSNVTGFTGKEIQLTQVAGSSTITAAVTDATQESLGLAKDGSVTISAALADGIKAEQTYKITLPSGYKFANTEADAAADEAGVYVSTTGADGTYKITPSTDNRTITVEVLTYTETMVPFGSSFTVNGLDVVNSNNVYNKSVDVTVRKSSDTLVTDTIATFNTFELIASVDADDVETYTAGVEAGSAVATITIKENLADSFRGGDLLITLPSSVDVTSKDDVVVNDVNSNLTGGTVSLNTAKNVITLSNVNFTGSVKGEITVDFPIIVPADFDGDVTATLSSGTNSIDVVKPIELGTIAKFVSKISVDTEVKEILAGYTNQAASDITISEKVAGTFSEGQTFTIALAADTTGYTGAYGITAPKVGTKLNVENGVAKVTSLTSGSTIIVTLSEIENDEKPVSMTLEGVLVSSNRIVPTYIDEAVEVTVAIDDYTTITKDYIKFVSELSKAEEAITNPGAVYNQNITMSLNSSQATLADGTKVDLYGTPYTSADGNYMVPVKGFAFALGLEAQDIVYDADAKMATFFLANNGIAQIQVGNKYATVNGVQRPLIDANGKFVTPVTKDGRFYLPLRAAGKTVFGVDVDYVAGTVTINPAK